MNQSPEPVSNAGLSLIGDAAVPGMVWFAVAHPLLAFCASLVLLAGFIWLLAKLLRLLEAGWAGLRRRFSAA